MNALVITMIFGLLIVAIGLSFLLGISNPVPWILIAVLILFSLAYRRLAERGRVKWKDAYSVGVRQLDDDHKQLIRLLNEFQTAYQYHTGEAHEQEALQALVDYTKYHFEREEQLMEENGYPDLEAHKAQHRSMIAEVDRFLDDYKERGHEALDGVASYLNGWLINHINGTDKQYSAFFKQKGVT